MTKESANSSKKPLCKVCEKPMQRYGFYQSGKQKWYCPKCKKVFSKKRKTFSFKQDVKGFADWLLNKETATRTASKSRSTFYRKNKKLWLINPVIDVTGEVYKVIIIDAKFLSNKTAVLLAVTPDFSVGYHWSRGGERADEYEALLSKLPAPKYLVCDGNKAILSVCRRLWPKTRIQRCFFHIERYIEHKIGKRPTTEAGAALKNILYSFMTVKTKLGAKRAELKFWRLFEKYRAFIHEKIYRKDVPPQDANKREYKPWWYAHKNLLAAYNHVISVIKNNQLWWWIEDNIPRTANDLEGGYNARIAELLRCHRGANLEHQKRIVEWYLLSRSQFGIDGFLSDYLSQRATFFDT